MNLDSYLSSHGYGDYEGNCSQLRDQINDLAQLAASPSVKNIMEIGFNAGHSTNVFLSVNSEAKVTSFDIGQHDYVHAAKKYIDATFPNRHTLILGDSTVTVPQFQNDVKFDLIFIDGGHDYEIAMADLKNCKALAHEDTVVVLDDTIFVAGWEAPWTVGPTRAWLEMLQEGQVEEHSRRHYCHGRGQVVGAYKMA